MVVPFGTRPQTPVLLQASTDDITARPARTGPRTRCGRTFHRHTDAAVPRARREGPVAGVDSPDRDSARLCQALDHRCRMPVSPVGSESRSSGRAPSKYPAGARPMGKAAGLPRGPLCIIAATVPIVVPWIVRAIGPTCHRCTEPKSNLQRHRAQAARTVGRHGSALPNEKPVNVARASFRRQSLPSFLAAHLPPLVHRMQLDRRPRLHMRGSRGRRPPGRCTAAPGSLVGLAAVRWKPRAFDRAAAAYCPRCFT
ncbi:hypothetical protein ABIB51_002226 [Arthrobacter sp. UYCu712]